MPTFLRSLAVVISLAALAGCPEERPGAEKQIPAQRVPPAVSLEPTPADAGGSAPDGGAPAPGAPRRP
ncbi:MAG TPA: hypothetical protein VF805_01295 [Anaeromyxobacteraceae bacterium]